MKIVIIRHAEPDRITNELTEKGKREAEYLKEFYSDQNFDEIYSSPLSRALDTCKTFCDNKREYKTLPWLKEFFHPIHFEGKETINWDFLPKDIINHKEIYTDDILKYKTVEGPTLGNFYNEVTTSLDLFLKEHGYERTDGMYKVIKSNKETIVLFCHLGISGVIISHLCHIPYSTMAQHFFLPPTGIITLVSEEREKGFAQFRVHEYANIDHLKIKKETPSKHGSFAEIFEDNDWH